MDGYGERDRTKTCVKTSIVVVVFNSGNYIRDLLVSVLNTDYSNFEVILVNCKSTDDSVRIIMEFAGDNRVKLVDLDHDPGYDEANNIGARLAKGEYLVLLNSDTIVQRDWLKELIIAMEEDERIGLAQSLVREIDPPHGVQCAGFKLIPYLGWTVKNLSIEETPILVSTVAAATRRDLIDSIGLLDKSFYFFFEDVDLSWRIWLNGFKAILAPNSVVYHYGGGTTKLLGLSEKRAFMIEYHTCKNCIRMLIKNYSSWNLIRYFPLSMIGMLGRALYGLLRDRQVVSLSAFLHAVAWNFRLISDTLRERRKIQRKIRRVKDALFLKKIAVSYSPLFLYRKYLAPSRCSLYERASE